MLNTVSVWEDIASWRSFRWQMKRRRMGPVKMWSGRSGKKEGQRILAQIKDGAYVLALAIEGKMLSSEELAGKIQKLGVEGKGHLVFVIGGSLGLSKEVMDRADYALSFSKMTFPHQLMRVILLEQLYRSYRIINHVPYHK